MRKEQSGLLLESYHSETMWSVWSHVVGSETTIPPSPQLTKYLAVVPQDLDVLLDGDYWSYLSSPEYISEIIVSYVFNR